MGLGRLCLKKDYIIKEVEAIETDSEQAQDSIQHTRSVLQPQIQFNRIQDDEPANKGSRGGRRQRLQRSSLQGRQRLQAGLQGDRRQRLQGGRRRAAGGGSRCGAERDAGRSELGLGIERIDACDRDVLDACSFWLFFLFFFPPFHV